MTFQDRNNSKLHSPLRRWIGLTAVLVFTSMSCMKVSKKGTEKENQNPATQPEVLTTPVLQPTIASPGPEVLSDFYKLKSIGFDYVVSNKEINFNFPREWPDLIYAEVIVDQSKIVIPVQNQRQWSFNWPSHDRKIQFRFHATPHVDVKPLKVAEILPPLNLKVDEVANLQSVWGLNTNVEKIFIEELTLGRQGKLLLGTFSGQVYIRKLQSENGSIQSFLTNQKAVKDQIGRSGGFVEFFVAAGSGNLNLTAIGEHGGDGSPGNQPDIHIKGTPGSDGVRSTFAFETPNCVGLGQGCSPIVIVRCITDPGPGSNGNRGDRGYPGLPGQNGGDSGRYLARHVPSEMSTTIFSREGSGGQGGHGGSGGEGGDGGLGGDGEFLDFLITNKKMSKESALETLKKPKFNFLPMASLAKCKAARNGEPGAPGLDGYPGANGTKGTNQSQN